MLKRCTCYCCHMSATSCCYCYYKFFSLQKSVQVILQYKDVPYIYCCYEGSIFNLLHFTAWTSSNMFVFLQFFFIVRTRSASNQCAMAHRSAMVDLSIGSTESLSLWYPSDSNSQSVADGIVWLRGVMVNSWCPCVCCTHFIYADLVQSC